MGKHDIHIGSYAFYCAPSDAYPRTIIESKTFTGKELQKMYKDLEALNTLEQRTTALMVCTLISIFSGGVSGFLGEGLKDTAIAAAKTFAKGLAETALGMAICECFMNQMNQADKLEKDALQKLIKANFNKDLKVSFVYKYWWRGSEGAYRLDDIGFTVK